MSEGKRERVREKERVRKKEREREVKRKRVREINFLLVIINI